MAAPPPSAQPQGASRRTMFQRIQRVRTSFRHQSFSFRLWFYVLLLGAYAGLAVLKEAIPAIDQVGDVPANIHALLGIILSLLLVFRTNTAYDRWWEGRKLWGQMINDSRSLIIKVRQLADVAAAEREYLAHLVVSLAYDLKDHLRGAGELQTLPGFEKALARPRHTPAYLISLIYERLAAWKKRGAIDGFTELLLDRHIANYSDIVGACERIRNTPLSESYRIYVRLCLFLYLLTLPWGLVNEYRYWTVPAMMIVSYFMLGLEMIALSVEEPFGLATDDLPLDDLCHANEATLHDLLDQPITPDSQPHPGSSANSGS